MTPERLQEIYEALNDTPPEDREGVAAHERYALSKRLIGELLDELKRMDTTLVEAAVTVRMNADEADRLKTQEPKWQKLLAAAQRFIAAQVDDEIATTNESEEYERALESLNETIAAFFPSSASVNKEKT